MAKKAKDDSASLEARPKVKKEKEVKPKAEKVDVSAAVGASTASPKKDDDTKPVDAKSPKQDSDSKAAKAEVKETKTDPASPKASSKPEKADAPAKAADKPASPADRPASPAPKGAQAGRIERKKNTSKVRAKRKPRRGDKRKKEQKEFNQKIIEIRRVTRMYKGGRRMRLSVFTAIGDGKGRVGLGLGKGADVRSAQQKAFNQAKNRLVTVPIQGNTIPHEVFHKEASAKVLLKPAVPGTGVVAGSSVRIIAELAGIEDILGKVLGSNNKINNAYATIEALKSLRMKRV